MILTRKIFVLLSAILMLGATTVQAQTPKSFPNEDPAFLEAFIPYVNKSKREESSMASSLFSESYNGMSADMRSVIRETANAMLKNKVRNYPVYTTYASMIHTIASQKGTIPQEHIGILRDLIIAAKPSAYKQFEQYMKYLPDLFENRVLYKTNTKSWSFNEGADYTMSVIDGRPALHFMKADITGASKKDTLTIYGTAGTCFPVSSKWSGKGGQLYFTRAGHLESEVSAEVSDYDFSLKAVDLVFDTVKFSMPAHLDGTVMGKVEEKLYTTTPQTISYPRFHSYDLDLEVKNLDERLSTSGGFQLNGTKMYIRGNKFQMAELTLTTAGKTQVKARARRFVVDTKENEIIAENTDVLVFLKKDSISHPSLIFKYFMDEDVVSLQRSDGIASNLPFKSQYHQMDLNINDLTWSLDSSDIKLRTISTYTRTPVTFTSYDHYVPGGELKYMTLTGRNTLRMVRDLADSYGTMELDGEALAGMMGYPLREIENILYKLTKDGFMFYDPESKRMTVDYKTFHYMEAGKGDIDFDHIQFTSDPKGSVLNGVISIDSQTIALNGVDRFDLSTIKQVSLSPRDSKVKLLEDRDMEMEGKLQAGKLDFKGEGMFFDYEGFKVEMQSVDSLIIYIKGEEMDYNGEYPDLPLRSVISDIKGTLYVDDPGNKAGVMDYAEYPYFESYDTAYVYFDDNYDSIKYPRDEFYFEVYPFTLDSISTAVTDSITFDGRLISADIFNPFETQLSVQKDRTLGIDEMTPEEGLDLYKSAGKFYDNFKLKKKGLFGDGRIEYRNSIMESGKFEFYRDSMYAVLDTFMMNADTSEDIPRSIIGKSVTYWLPYRDTLFVESTDKPNLMYDEKLIFNGNLIYTAGNLYGVSDSGELSNFKLTGAKIQAAEGEFMKDYFITSGGSLSLKSEDIKDELVSVMPINTNINFATQIGSFSTESDTVITNIPGTSLITNVREFEWDMAERKVTFINNESGDYYFTSTLPAYDSLQISAQTAVYDIVENKVYANEVNEISLADSKVIPAGKLLTIQQGGKIEALENATLVLNREESYHQIDDGDLVITSRNDFSGTGSYSYQGATGTPYKVVIDEISVKTDTADTDKKKITEEDMRYFVQARGIIPEEDAFRLDEQLFYKGNVYLYSNDKDIKFEGFGKLDLKQNEESSWFNLNQGIDPDNFSLGLDSLIDEYRQEVVAGLYVSPGELDLYSAVFNPKRSPKDPAIYQATGSLYKGEQSGEYIFGEADVVNGENNAGTIMYYDDNTGAVKIDGQLNWVSNIPMVTVDGYGTLEYDPVTKISSAITNLAIDFPMDDAIWYQLPRDIVEFEEKNKGIKYNRDEIKRALKYFIPNANDAANVIEDIKAEGYFQLPANFPYKMFLTDVELKWDPVDGNYKSSGLIGVSNINNYPIDLRIKAYTEFGYNLGSGYMNLYFETSSGEWFYFSTHRGKMFVLSSDQTFNDAVVNADDKEVRDGKKGPVIFEFLPGNLTSKLTFMARMDDYLSRVSVIETPVEKPVEEAPVKETPIEEIPVQEEPTEDKAPEETPEDAPEEEKGEGLIEKPDAPEEE